MHQPTHHHPPRPAAAIPATLSPHHPPRSPRHLPRLQIFSFFFRLYPFQRRYFLRKYCLYNNPYTLPHNHWPILNILFIFFFLLFPFKGGREKEKKYNIYYYYMYTFGLVTQTFHPTQAHKLSHINTIQRKMWTRHTINGVQCR